MQLLNVFSGGTLVPHLETTETHRLEDHERHQVEIDSKSRLHELLGATGAVTSSHHQAVERLGNGLRVAAQHADGTIEAIEWADPKRKPWLIAVQWHPERMEPDEPFAGPIFRAFLEAVAASRR